MTHQIVHKFVAVPEDVAMDKSLPLEARGLLVTMMSNPSGPLTLEEIADRAGVLVATARRLVRDLRNQGYVEEPVFARLGGKFVATYALTPRVDGQGASGWPAGTGMS